MQLEDRSSDCNARTCDWDHLRSSSWMITSVLFGSPITVLSNVVGSADAVTNRLSSSSVTRSSSIGTNRHVLLSAGSMTTVMLVGRKSASATDGRREERGGRGKGRRKEEGGKEEGGERMKGQGGKMKDSNGTQSRGGVEGGSRMQER